jgi:hypothetical protein
MAMMMMPATTSDVLVLALEQIVKITTEPRSTKTSFIS